jgi:mannosyltransferase OCH1-like enzyme
MIPKIIMQTWKTKDVPDKWKESPESIKKFFPDYEYVLMTDADNRAFVQKYFPDFLPFYDNFPYNIQRADAIRYMWLYINGGIYLDLDLVVVKNFENLIKDEDFYLVPSGNVNSVFTNSLMISKPGVKIWLNAIEEMKKPLPKYWFTKHTVVMNSTGPMMLSRIIKDYDNSFGLIPANLIFPCSVCDIKCPVKNAYLKPLEGQSWNGIDSHLLNFVMCYYKHIIVFIIMLAIIMMLTYKQN